MAYSIQYGAGEIRKEEIKPAGFPYSRQLLTGAAIFLLLMGIFSFIGVDNIKTFLLPGDPAVTEAAFVGMVEDIRAGERLSDAVTAFCQEIMDGAGLYE